MLRRPSAVRRPGTVRAACMWSRCWSMASGCTAAWPRLGVEALELKIAGYSGTDIAKLYGVQPNHVGAWISRAAQKLKKDLFLVENGSTNP